MDTAHYDALRHFADRAEGGRIGHRAIVGTDAERGQGRNHLAGALIPDVDETTIGDPMSAAGQNRCYWTDTAREAPAHPALSGELTQVQLDNRRMLREAMAQAGWRGINTERWHFDGGDRDRIRAEYLRVL